MVNIVKYLIKKILLIINNIETTLSERWACSAHKRKFLITWSGIWNLPEYFDHKIDLYYQWPSTLNPSWLERGIYNLKAIQMFNEPTVLELCCGDGFNAKYFYSTSANLIDCVDYNKGGLDVARKKNSVPNIHWHQGDLSEYFIQDSSELLDGYTNVIWDMAILYFEKKTVKSILGQIKNKLGDKGILSGSTIANNVESNAFCQHKFEFRSQDELRTLLQAYFINVYVFETDYDDRRNLYFFASDGDIPF